MKILFIRNANRFSGSETYNINLFRQAQENKSYKIYLLTNLSALASRVARLGFKSYITPWAEEGIGTKKQLLRAFIRLPIIIPHYLFLISSLEKGKRFNLICLQSMTEKIFLTPILKIRGDKVVWTELGPLYATQMSRLVTFLYRMASLSVDKIVAISKDTRKDLIKGGVKESKIVPIYIGINVSQYKPLTKSRKRILRKNYGISQRAVVIGFLGTVTREKGINDFVSTSKLLHNHSKSFHFLVIGDGDQLTSTKRTVKKAGLVASYTFTNFVDNVISPLGIIDVLLLPTHHFEGISLALLEAQSMGKIVITRDIGGNREIVKNEINGFLYNYERISDVANLIRNVTSKRTELRKLSVEARKNILEKFNIRTQAKLFFEVLKSYDHRS